MALRFLDEQQSMSGVAAPVAAPAPARRSRLRFIDEPASAAPPAPKKTRLRFLDEAPTRLSLNDYIDQLSQQYGIDSSLPKAMMMQESMFNPNAVSPAGAVGIAQFMPETWAGVANQMGEAPGDRRDPYTAARRAVFHLADLQRKFGGRADLALAAYKTGEGRVRKAGGKIPDTIDPGAGGERTPDYVAKVLRHQEAIKSGQIPQGLYMQVSAPGARYQQPEAGTGFGDIAPEVEPTQKEKGALRKFVDVSLKAAEWLNFVNAASWAGVMSALGDEDYRTLYRKYQDEGNPVALAIKNTMRDAGITNKWALMAGGIVGDIVGDPLTYVGIGGLTKAGRAAKAAKGLSKIPGTGRRIRALNSVLQGMDPAARALAATGKEQARLGQRALLQVGGRTVIKGAPVIGAVEQAGEFVRPAFAAFSTTAKIKDPVQRKIATAAAKEARRLKGYFQDILNQKIANNNRAFKKLDDAQRTLVTEIAESPKMYEEALAGAHRDIGRTAAVHRDYLELSKGLRENNPEALAAIGAENLLGKWEHKVPELGGNFERLMEAQIRFANNAMGRVEDAANRTLRDRVRDIRRIADGDAAKINRKFDAQIKNGYARDVVEGRRREALDLLSARTKEKFDTALSQHDDTILKKLQGSKQVAYRQNRMAALKEAQESLPLYQTHTLPEDVAGKLRRPTPGGAAEFSESVADEVARKLVDANGMPTYTVADINRFARMGINEIIAEGVPAETAHRIKGMAKAIEDARNAPNLMWWVKRNPEQADAMFSTNPGYIEKVNAQRTAKAISGATYRAEMGRGLGKTVDEIIANPELYEGFKRIDKWKNTKEGKLFFSPEVADEINRVEGMFFGNEETRGLLKLFDNVQNYWKAWTLAPFPAYHNRNLVSAIFNNWIGGVKDPRAYSTALQIQYADALATKTRLSLRERMLRGLGKLQGTEDEVIDAARNRGRKMLQDIKLENGMSAQEAIALARQNGIRGASVYDEELISGLSQSRNPLSSRGPVIRKGREVGGAIEDHVRLANFFDGLNSGMSPADAAERVMATQFDYGDITKFERNVMTRLLPFWRFTRFNIPLQLRSVIQKPGIYSGMEHVRRQINVEQDMPKWKEVLLQDYQASNVPVQVGTAEIEGKTVPRLFTLGNWMPNYTALQNLAHPTETLLGMVTPFLKTPLERRINYDFYRRRPIVDEKRGRYKEPFLNVPIPNKSKHIIKNIRILNEIDRLIGAGVTTLAPDKSHYVLRSGFKPDAWEQVGRLLSGVTRSPFAAEEAQASKLGKLKSDYLKALGGGRIAARRGDKANVEAAKARMMEIIREAAAIGGLQPPQPQGEQQ